MCVLEISTSPLEPLRVLWLGLGENFTLSPIFCITYVILEGLEAQLHVMDTCEATSMRWLR